MCDWVRARPLVKLDEEIQNVRDGLRLAGDTAKERRGEEKREEEMGEGGVADYERGEKRRGESRRL